MIQVLNVRPEDVHLLATEADASKIIKHIRVSDEDSKFLQAKWLFNYLDEDTFRSIYNNDYMFENVKRAVQTEKPKEKQFYEEIT